MKVLLSAYACAPGEGSEPEAGLRVLAAAAQRHEVWVLFRADQSDRLENWVADQGLENRIHLVPVDIGGTNQAFSWSRIVSGLHYWRWQRAAKPIAQCLDAMVGFDLLHHVTYATYYMPVAIASIQKPLVWGPVGGGDQVPWRMWPSMGLVGMTRDLARLIVQKTLTVLASPPYRTRKNLETLVQNQATARAIGKLEATVLPNGSSVDVGGVAQQPAAERNDEVLVVGRLYPPKGGWLAVMAMRYAHRPSRLVFLGDGPQQPRLERLVQRLRLEERVVFAGAVPRIEAMNRVRNAGVVLHSALRDEAPLAVGEAMSLGTPVVMLEGTGAHELVSNWPDGYEAISPTTPQQTARSLAAAIDRALELHPPVPSGPIGSVLEFSQEILSAYRRAVDDS